MAQLPDAYGVDLVAAFTRLQSLTLSTARVNDFLSECWDQLRRPSRQAWRS